MENPFPSIEFLPPPPPPFISVPLSPSLAAALGPLAYSSHNNIDKKND